MSQSCVAGVKVMTCVGVPMKASECSGQHTGMPLTSKSRYRANLENNCHPTRVYIVFVSRTKIARERHSPKDCFDKTDDDDREQKVPACAQPHLRTLISADMLNTRTEGAAACRSSECIGTETREITVRSIQTAPAAECEGSCPWLCVPLYACLCARESTLGSESVLLRPVISIQNTATFSPTKFTCIPPSNAPHHYHCRLHCLMTTVLGVCGYPPRNMGETRCASPTGTRTDS